MNKSNAIFDVIIPTYNNRDELKQCLDGFKKQVFTDFRILLCVDGSTDGTLEYIRQSKYPFQIKILTHPDHKNHGRNAARNLAIPHLIAKYLMTLDSDVVPSENLLNAHYAFLKNTDCISAGNIVFTNRKSNAWADYYSTRGKYKFKHGSEIPGMYLTTGNVAFQSKYFIQIDGQDADMDQYGGGDTEFAWRMEQTFHLPVRYNQEAQGFSDMNKSLPEALQQMYHFGAVNLHYIRNKHPEFKSLFRFDLIESPQIHHRLLRWIFNFPWNIILQPSLQWMPAFVRRKCIHFLVFFQMYHGYLSKV